MFVVKLVGNDLYWNGCEFTKDSDFIVYGSIAAASLSIGSRSCVEILPLSEDQWNQFNRKLK